MTKKLLTPQAYLTFIILLVGTGGILYGFDVGVISGALLLIQKTVALSSDQLEIIVGAVFAGSLFGTLFAGPLADSVGRRFVIGFASATFILGIFCVIGSNGFWLLLIGRILLGVGIGIVSVAVPLYALELAPTKHRGLCVSVFQLFLTFGILVAFFIDLIFVKYNNWHAMFEVVLIPAFILLIGVFLLPESPRWLIVQHEEARARNVLNDLHEPEEVEKEMQIIHKSVSKMEGAWRDLFKKNMIAPLSIAIACAVLQQLTGINVILQYAPVMLKAAGFGSNYVSMLGSVGIGVFNFIFTIIGMFLIDRIGRRPLLLTGLVGIVIAEILLGFFAFLSITEHLRAILSLAGLCLFILSFAIGPGVAIWLVMSELFPTDVRGKGLALCLFFNSLASTVAASFFLTLKSAITIGGVYWLAAFFTLCYFLVVKFGFPETRARSLEEIQEEFERS